jgi:hypothetical protein
MTVQDGIAGLSFFCRPLFDVISAEMEVAYQTADISD